LGVFPLSAVLKTDTFYGHAWCERCLAHEVACMRVRRVLGYCRCEVCEGCLNATLSLSRLNSPDMEGRRQQHLLSCPHSEGMPPIFGCSLGHAHCGLAQGDLECCKLSCGQAAIYRDSHWLCSIFLLIGGPSPIPRRGLEWESLKKVITSGFVQLLFCPPCNGVPGALDGQA